MGEEMQNNENSIEPTFEQARNLGQYLVEILKLHDVDRLDLMFVSTDTIESRIKTGERNEGNLKNLADSNLELSHENPDYDWLPDNSLVNLVKNLQLLPDKPSFVPVALNITIEYYHYEEDDEISEVRLTLSQMLEAYSSTQQQNVTYPDGTIIHGRLANRTWFENSYELYIPLNSDEEIYCRQKKSGVMIGDSFYPEDKDGMVQHYNQFFYEEGLQNFRQTIVSFTSFVEGKYGAVFAKRGQNMWQDSPGSNRKHLILKKAPDSKLAIVKTVSPNNDGFKGILNEFIKDKDIVLEQQQTIDRERSQFTPELALNRLSDQQVITFYNKHIGTDEFMNPSINEMRMQINNTLEQRRGTQYDISSELINFYKRYSDG